MDDLTLLYYTANLIEPVFGYNIRRNLESIFPEGVSIISISHRPMLFGKNICVPHFDVSIYNIYRQILLGAKAAKTRWVACVEDDSFYNREHFEYRPPEDAFAYNMNRWIIDNDIFFHRNRANMSMCIAPRDLMIDTLERRFRKFPRIMSREEMGQVGGFGEPGKLEAKYGLPTVKMHLFNTETPTIVFNHRPSVGGVRKVLATDKVVNELPYWGKACDLWKKTYGKE